MDHLDTAKIIREAKDLRAIEMQRLQGLMARQLGLYFRLLAGFAADTGRALQQLLSGNPQAHH